MDATTKRKYSNKRCVRIDLHENQTPRRALLVRPVPEHRANT